MRSLKMLYGLLTSRERTILGMLLVLLVFASFLEVIGVGLVFPYISLLQNPGQIQTNVYLNRAYRFLGFNSTKSFFVFLSLALLGVFVTKALFTIWLNRFQMRFVYTKQNELGRRLFRSYMYAPYSFFLSVNTATLIGNLTTSLTQLCGGVMQSTLTLIAESMIAAGLVLFLFYLSPLFSTVAALFLGVFAWLFMRFIRTSIAFCASENDRRWKGMIRVVNEGLSSVKELQVLGRQQYFVDAYAEECRHFSRAVTVNAVLTQLPRVFMETSAIAGMVLFVVFGVVTGKFQQQLFPILAVFALAIVRIVPSANRILQAWNGVSFYTPAIYIVEESLARAVVRPPESRSTTARMTFQHQIAISIGAFAYPSSSSFLLQSVDIKIARGERVALIGRSGSGKTTLVDLILGVFPDFDGHINVDGTDIREKISEWRNCIGYIPQSIYLRDDTIVKNVALGIPDSEIDRNKIERAIALAGLEAVVRSQPSGLETVVGDRGIRLSGGERQRIGIARALYHDPDLLVLDEATSALDNETEKQIVDSILSLGSAKTIIVIAHRLSSVMNCDRLYLMEAGRVIDQGPFGDLAARHPNFVHPSSTLRPQPQASSLVAASKT